MSRFPTLSLIALLTSTACGGAGAHSYAKTAPAGATLRSTSNVSSALAEGSEAPKRQEEQLVIEGFITARVDEVGAATRTIRDKVQAAGGRVVQETGSGAKTGWQSFVKVRLPPSGVAGLVEWLGDNGDIVSKRIESEDVSKELFDQELALQNLNMTMSRLQELLKREDLDIEAVLKIESEMTRVRADIEAIKGSQRFLKDRVAFATLELSLERRDGVDHGPETKFMPGVRLASMRLLDAGSRTSTRYGYGLVLRSPMARVSYELDVFEAVDDDKRAIIATLGGAAYSDHLGGGRKRFLNPYLGMRLGYGRLEGSNFVLAGEAGLELFKNDFAIFDVNVRGTSFFGEGGPEVAVVSAAEISIAF